jgi:hypothetical protein
MKNPQHEIYSYSFTLPAALHLLRFPNLLIYSTLVYISWVQSSSKRHEETDQGAGEGWVEGIVTSGAEECIDISMHDYEKTSFKPLERMAPNLPAEPSPGIGS